MTQLLFLALAGVAAATVYPSLFWTGFIEQADALSPAEAVACVNRTPRVRTSAYCCTLARCLLAGDGGARHSAERPAMTRARARVWPTPLAAQAILPPVRRERRRGAGTNPLSPNQARAF